MRPIKIIYIITGLYVGGAERLLLDTVRALDKNKYEPLVVSLVGGDLIPEFQQSGIQTININMSRIFPLFGAWRLFKLLRAKRPDIVHTHLIHADFFGRVLGRLCRVPIIITTLHMVEDARRKFPYLALNRFTAKFNTAFIAVSDSVKDELVELERLDPEKVIVIRNAVMDSEKASSRIIKNLRAQFGANENLILLGIVSRLEVPRKGHHILFNALAQLSDRFPHLHCVVIGDGDGRKQLEEQVCQLGIEEQVTFVGTQNNIPEWLGALDIFVLPSLLEGFPMSIIEAMSANRPIIATHVGGVGELIQHEQEGLLIKPDDVFSLVKAIECLACNTNLRHQLGEAARKRFEQNFEIKTAVTTTQEFYNKFVQEKNISRTVHLLEVITNFDPGGVPRHVNDLVANLSKDKFKIEWVSGETLDERISLLDIPHHFAGIVKPIHPLKDLRALWQLTMLFKRLKPDVVHAHMSKAICLSSIAARITGVRCVLGTIHGRTLLKSKGGFHFKQFIFNIVENVTLGFFTHGTISVSRATAKYLAQSGKVSPAHNVTIYNGAHPFTSSLLNRNEIRKKLGIGESQKVILMIGRLVYQKTPEILIEACALLRNQFPDFVCLIAGDGPDHRILTDLIDSKNLNETVRLLGHREDIPDLLHASDIFTLCTRYEGQSIAVLEAMTAALPVIATKVPGMDEVVVHGKTGYLIDENSPKSCADALELLLANPEMARTMGVAGYQRFEQNFSFSRQLIQTEQLLWICGQSGFPDYYKFVEEKPIKLKHPLVKENIRGRNKRANVLGNIKKGEYDISSQI